MTFQQFPTFITASYNAQGAAGFTLFEQGARRSFRNVSKEADGAGRVISNRLRAGADAAGALEGPLGRVAGRLSAVGRLFDRLGVGQAALLGVGALSAALVGASGSILNYQALLRAATSDQEDFNRANELSAKIANDSRSSLNDTIRFYARLTRASEAYGLSQQQVATTTTVALQATRLSGAGLQEASAAAQQFSQAIASGRLNGDEFRSLSENASVLLQTIGQGLLRGNLIEGFRGTMGELRQLSREGELTTERIVAALEIMRSEVEKDFSRLPLTVEQAMTALANNVTQAVISFENTTGALNGLARSILFVSENMGLLVTAGVTAAGFFAGRYLAVLLASDKATKAWAVANLFLANTFGTVVARSGSVAALGVAFGTAAGRAALLTRATTALGAVLGAINWPAVVVAGLAAGIVYLANRTDEATKSSQAFAAAQGIIADRSRELNTQLDEQIRKYGELSAVERQRFKDQAQQLAPEENAVVASANSLIDRTTGIGFERLILRSADGSGFISPQAQKLIEERKRLNAQLIAVVNGERSGLDFKRLLAQEVSRNTINQSEADALGRALADVRAVQARVLRDVRAVNFAGVERDFSYINTQNSGAVAAARAQAEAIATTDKLTEARQKLAEADAALVRGIAENGRATNEQIQTLAEARKAVNDLVKAEDERRIKDRDSARADVIKEVERLTGEYTKNQQAIISLNQDQQILNDLYKSGEIDVRTYAQAQDALAKKLVAARTASLEAQGIDLISPEEGAKQIDALAAAQRKQFQDANQETWDLYETQGLQAIQTLGLFFGSRFNGFGTFASSGVGGNLLRGGGQGLLSLFGISPGGTTQRRNAANDEYGILSSSRIAQRDRQLLEAGVGSAQDLFLYNAQDRVQQSLRVLSDGLKPLAKAVGSLFGGTSQLAIAAGQGFGGFQVGSSIGALADVLGIGGRGTSTGASVGGTVGGLASAFTGIPGLDIAGSLLGGVLGSIFGGSPVDKAAATINLSDGRFSPTNIKQDDGGRIDVATQLSDAVGSALLSIADQLGASLSDGTFGQIGERKGKFFFDPTPDSSRSFGDPRKNPGLQTFDTAEQAATAAIRYAIDNDSFDGLRESTANLLKSTSNLDLALSKASAFEATLKELEGANDPLGSAIQTLNDEFSQMITIFGEAGAAVEEYAGLQGLYQDKLDELISNSTATLAAFSEGLDFGNGSPLSVRDQLANIMPEFERLAATIRGGGTVDQSRFVELGQERLNLVRQAEGSRQPFFDVLNELQGLTDQAIQNVTGNVSSVTNAPSFEPPAPATVNVDPRIVDTLQQLNGWGGLSAEYLEQIANQITQLNVNLSANQTSTPSNAGLADFSTYFGLAGFNY